MSRLSFSLLVLFLAAGIVPAEAERWLRALATESPKSGAYDWFDVDSVFHDKTSGLVLTHAVTATVKAIRAGGLTGWTLWGFDCKGQKGFLIGSVGKDGKFAKNANWKTDAKAIVALAPPTKDNAVVAALGTKMCAWADVWPPGAMP
jgi:hypothetical protein